MWFLQAFHHWNPEGAAGTRPNFNPTKVPIFYITEASRVCAARVADKPTRRILRLASASEEAVVLRSQCREIGPSRSSRRPAMATQVSTKCFSPTAPQPHSGHLAKTTVKCHETNRIIGRRHVLIKQHTTPCAAPTGWVPNVSSIP